jgi:hypothetical protein
MKHQYPMTTGLLPGRITLTYELVASGTGGAGVEEEPLAVCTFWYSRSHSVVEQQRLVAWHYPTGGQQVAMPIEWMGASTSESYGVGQFIVLPHCALTLTLHDAVGRTYGLAEIELVPSGRPRRYVDMGPSDWDLVITWSDGVGVDLSRRGHAYRVCRVGEQSLSQEQCSAFLHLGGMLRADPRSLGDIVDASVTCAPLDSGVMGFVLLTQTVPGGAVSEHDGCIAHATYASLQEAAEHGRLDLDACWVLLPPRCQACKLPIFGAAIGVQTLWGPVHLTCLTMDQLQESMEAASSSNPVVPDAFVAAPGQLALL